MANILSVEQISKTYGDKVLVDHVSFGIEEGQRIGLIGVNGTGKSTLLRMIAGLDVPDSGSMVLTGKARVHFLPQEPVFGAGDTVLSAVFQGDMEEMVLLRNYEETLAKLARDPEAVEGREGERLIRLQTRMDALGAWDLEHEAKTILTRLGVDDFDADVSKLSGGQRKRVAMARALIQPSDLLVMDEPTNHIDNETVAWLEGVLAARKGALLMVTHDRYFLDRVVNRILELDHGHLYAYPGSYSAFLEAKMEREVQAQASEEKRQNFLRNELKWIQRGPRARGTKQKARTERYYDVLEQGPQDPAGNVELSSAKTRLGKTVIELHGVSKGYSGSRLISGFEYIVLRDDRIGIVGPNGAGKSTLLKMMAGRMEPDEGEVVIGSTVKIGYFSQEHTDMPLDMRVIDYIRDEAAYVTTADGETITAAQMLERFLFPGNLQWVPIAKLSGGEKRRLALLKVLMQAPNVLLLDEPTNDLDIPTLATLEAYLDDFSGAVVVVSHDRYFLDRVCDKIFAFEGGSVVTQHTGNFSDYVERKRATGAEAGAPAKDGLARRGPERGDDGGTSAGARGGTKSGNDERGDGDEAADRKAKKLKFSWSEQKEYETIEDKIAEVEQALEDVNAKMKAAGADYGKVNELYNEQQALEARLNDLMERWAYLSELAEAIEQNRGRSL